MADVRTETVGPDDWRSWRDVRLRSLQHDPEAFGSTHEHEAAFTEQTWRSRLDGTGGPSVLAYAGDEPVGIGAGWLHEPGRLMVVAMWTEPDRRGQGIGRRVLDHVVGWAHDRGLSVDLWVADGNPDARRLYERYGFRPDGGTAPIREGADATMSHLVLPG
ncbi:GNAT family N-acetyltransferase [Plantactinospora endophytica]|uniref:GNAT family N-acetyltransferase n=1 Tax=Plantactinospora endophytica TaxID=673535 RepID=UPI0019447E89|nr:GNAT family N-acetyltransferase [Plantactinospora endophytica]